MIGKSEQLTTTGKNLINNEELKFLDNYTDKNTTYYIYRLTGLITGEKYTLSRGEILKSGNTLLFGVSANQLPYDNAQFLLYDGLNESYNRKSITWTQENEDYVDLLFSYNSNSSQTTQEKLTEFFERVSYVQLEKGTSPTAYEPYTGGKSSPSPEYPQEIKNVGKWNPETQKYEVEVRVTGNNILNTQIEPDAKGIYQGWKVGDGKKKITLSIIDKGNNKDISDCYFGLSGNGTDQEDGVAWLIESGKITKTKTTSLNPYVTIFPSDETAQRKILERFDIQCEFGEIQTEYQPYKEQTLTLTSDRPITKWDKLVEQDGQIGWLYQSAIDDDVKPSRKDLFPYDFYLYKDHESGVYTYNVTNQKKEKGYQTSFCKQFKNMNASYSTGELFCYSDQPSLQTQYFSTDIPTLEEFKQWMENNPLTMLYKTKTPEFVPLPQSEQDAILALLTYYPTTVITVDGGEVDPDIEVSYIADTKNYIDQKIAAIGKTVVDTQKALL